MWPSRFAPIHGDLHRVRQFEADMFDDMIKMRASGVRQIRYARARTVSLGSIAQMLCRQAEVGNVRIAHHLIQAVCSERLNGSNARVNERRRSIIRSVGSSKLALARL
jgi:hypothetical protein